MSALTILNAQLINPGLRPDHVAGRRRHRRRRGQGGSGRHVRRTVSTGTVHDRRQPGPGDRQDRRCRTFADGSTGTVTIEGGRRHRRLASRRRLSRSPTGRRARSTIYVGHVGRRAAIANPTKHARNMTLRDDHHPGQRRVIPRDGRPSCQTRLVTDPRQRSAPPPPRRPSRSPRAPMPPRSSSTSPRRTDPTITINAGVIGNRFDVDRTVTRALRRHQRFNGQRA